ncbi:MAG: aldehyde dehydrogenase family protein, partial [Nocardioides sp.]|nr:aldehyde dehydrogenase family protein [Nocardioides sp.]
MTRTPTNAPAQQLVDGKLSEATGGETYAILNPATGQEIGQAPDSTADDVDAAIGAARRAFDETDWSRNHAFRAQCLRQLHQALVENAEAMRALTTAEAGAPAFLTSGPQYDAPVEGLAWVADLAERYEWAQDLGIGVTMGISSKRTVHREATGVVAAITPWNFPNQINLAKLGPALAAGNTVVLKPAPDTPWLAAELGRIITEQTDIPAGVVNVVTPADN